MFRSAGEPRCGSSDREAISHTSLIPVSYRTVILFPFTKPEGVAFGTDSLPKEHCH